MNKKFLWLAVILITTIWITNVFSGSFVIDPNGKPGIYTGASGILADTVLHWDGPNMGNGIGDGITEWRGIVVFGSPELDPFYGNHEISEAWAWMRSPVAWDSVVVEVYEGVIIEPVGPSTIDLGTLVYSQNITSEITTLDAFTVHTLSSPVPLQSGEIYAISIHIYQITNDFPLGCDNGPMVPLRGGWVWDPTLPNGAQLADFGLNYNWNIRMGLDQVPTTPDYLVWVHPDVVLGSAASGDSLFNALVANGQSAFLTDNLFEFGTNLGIYRGVFVVLGIFSNNGVLLANSAEALALETYVMAGGSLYLEGGDCFYYDPQFSGGHDINPWFDCVPLADGSGDVFNLLGLNELGAFTFAYSGENNWMDHLSSGGLSSQIWQESTTQNIHGLYYDGFGGAAIGVVPSFGGMTSTTSMVSSQKRTYDGLANQLPELGSFKTPEERVANNKPFRKRYGYKPELATRIDRSEPLYKINPSGSIEFLANNQTDLMAAYLMLMNPAPELMYYKFNEAGSTYTVNFAAAGSPVPDTAQVLGLTMGGTGYEGSALIGNGGASSTNYVNTGWATSLSGSWTISLWVNDMETVSASTRYFFGDLSAQSFRCFVGGVAGNGNLLLRGTGMTDVLVSGVAPGPSEVVFVYDDVVQEVRGYLNGQLQVTVPQAAPLVFSGAGPFKVGGYSSSVGIPLNTLLDEFKMYSRAVDVTPNSRDYAVPEFVDLPQFWYVGVPYDVKALVVNEGSNAQTDVPVRLFIDGVQEGSDVLVSLASEDTAVVSFPWTPSTAGMTNIEIQSFLAGDQDTSNDSVTTDVTVTTGAPVMTVTPAFIEDTLAAGPTSTDTITIGNVAGAGPLDFEITIEGVTTANTKVDFIAANGQARRAPILARGKEIPVAEYLNRANAAQKTISFQSEHPEDQGEPYDQIMPHKSGNGLNKIADFSPDGEEIFGNNSTVYGPAGLRGRGNHFYCSTSTTLTEHRLYLNMTATSDMQFLVYEGDVQVGIYNLVNVSEIASSGTGEGWYSSGSISVPLVAGKYYLIYPQWTQNANYYADLAVSPYPYPASFGELQMGIGYSWVGTYSVPPATTQNVPSTAFGATVAYYQTIVTGAGTSWLSVDPEMGTIPAGQSMDVEVTFDANGILGGDYYANIIVNGNDPFNLSDTVSAHLYVEAEPNVGFNPDPVVFDTTFVGQTSDMSAQVLNTGAGPLTVSNITSSNPVFSVSQTAFTVPPLDSVEITVSFSPTSAGSETGTLTIASDDPTDPNYVVSVEGEALLPPQIGVNPSSIIDSVLVNDSMDVTIQISNNATGNAAALDWSASVSITTAGKRLHIPAASPNFPRGEYPASMGPAPTDGYGIIAPSDPPLNMALVPRSAWGIEQANAFVTYFDLLIPQVLYNLAPDPTNADFDNAGDFAPGDQSFFYNLGSAGELVKVDTTTGAGTVLGNVLPPAGQTWAAMATDPTDGTIYAASLQISVASTLNIIDPDNLTATPVGPIGAPGIISLAVDGNGDMWAHDLVNDVFLSIDKTTGAATTVGPLGFDANYGQGMTWDPASDQLYMAAFNNLTFVPELRIVDRTTGGSQLVGVLGQSVPGGLCQLGFLAIPGAGGANFIVLMGPTSGSVDPGDVQNLDVRIYGLDVLDTTYYANIEIESNDPVNPLVTIPVEIKVVSVIGIGDLEQMPTTFAISQNYPNPFNPTTSFKYQLPEVADVKLVIYNVLGQKVRTLINKGVEPGYHTIEWNGFNDAGNQVATGLYIYRFEAGNYVKTMKMMMLK